MTTLPRSRALVLTAALATLTLMTGCAAAAPSTDPSGDSGLQPPTILSSGTLSVCVANASSPPNTIFDEVGELTGLEIDLINAVADELSLKPAIVQSAFSALIPSLQAKQCDVIMSTLYIKAEREEVVDFVPYLLSGSAIAVPTGNPDDVTGLDSSLCGLRAIVTVGTTAEELARAKSDECEAEGESAIDISTSDQITVALQQLANQQVDVYLDTAELIGYYIESTDAPIEMAGQPFDTIQIGAATRKDDSALHDAIEEAFASLHSNGRYDEIIATWGASDLALTD